MNPEWPRVGYMSPGAVGALLLIRQFKGSLCLLGLLFRWPAFADRCCVEQEAWGDWYRLTATFVCRVFCSLVWNLQIAPAGIHRFLCMLGEARNAREILATIFWIAERPSRHSLLLAYALRSTKYSRIFWMHAFACIPAHADVTSRGGLHIF